MSLNANDIKKIAHLARLAVSDTEIDALSNDISNLLKLVAAMNSANTKNITPMAHPYDEKQPLRTDVVTERDQRHLFQQIAPETDQGLYLVPQVIDN